MKVEFYTDNLLHSYIFNKISIFLKENGGGKTDFLNYLNDGFTGKGDETFNVNGINVDKSMFNVSYFDELFNYDDYLKFKVRGKMFKIFKTNVIEDMEEKLLQYISNMNETFNSTIDDNYFDKLNNELLLNKVYLKMGVEELNEVYDEMFNLKFEIPIISSAAKIELVLKHAIMYSDPSRYNIFIIDNFDAFLDINTTHNLLHFMSNYDNCIFILSSSSAKSLGYSCCDYYLDLKQKIKFEEMYKYLFLKENFAKEMCNQKFEIYYNDNLHLITSEDMRYIKKELNCFLPLIIESVIFNKKLQVDFPLINNAIEYLSKQKLC